MLGGGTPLAETQPNHLESSNLAHEVNLVTTVSVSNFSFLAPHFAERRSLRCQNYGPCARNEQSELALKINSSHAHGLHGIRPLTAKLYVVSSNALSSISHYLQNRVGPFAESQAMHLESSNYFAHELNLVTTTWLYNFNPLSSPLTEWQPPVCRPIRGRRSAMGGA